MIMGIGRALAERWMNTSTNTVPDLSCMSLTTEGESLPSQIHMHDDRSDSIIFCGLIGHRSRKRGAPIEMTAPIVYSDKEILKFPPGYTE